MKFEFLIVIVIIITGCVKSGKENSSSEINKSVKAKYKIVEINNKGQYETIRNLNHSRTELVESAGLKCSIMKYKYEEDKLISIRYLNSDGIESSHINEVKFIYDENGKLKEQNNIYTNNELIGKTLYKYDKKGQLIEKINKNHFPSTFRFEHIKEEGIVRVKFYDDGEEIPIGGLGLIIYVDYKYDSENRIIEEVSHCLKNDSTLISNKPYKKKAEFYYENTGRLKKITKKEYEKEEIYFHYSEGENLYGVTKSREINENVFLDKPYESYEEIVSEYLVIKGFLKEKYPRF